MAKVKIQLTSLFSMEGLSSFEQRQAENYGNEIDYRLNNGLVSFSNEPKIGQKVRLYNYLSHVSEEAKEYASRIKSMVFPILSVEDHQAYY